MESLTKTFVVHNSTNVFDYGYLVVKETSLVYTDGKRRQMVDWPIHYVTGYGCHENNIFYFRCLVRGQPSSNLKRGPSSLPLHAMYNRTAETGHRSVPDRPMKMWIPRQRGSVLLRFMFTLSSEGFEWLSTAMSCGERCWSGSLETVNSPALRKPKNPSMWVSGTGCCFDHSAFILQRMSGVTGRWSLRVGEVNASACARFAPFRTYSSLGQWWSLNGSGSPTVIWR